MMFDCLGYPPDDPHRVTAAARDRQAAGRRRRTRRYCQPCLSPVWDTALACHALMEVGERARSTPAIRRGARLAGSAAGARRRRRLGGGAARTCGPAAGPSNTPTRIIPTSTTPPSVGAGARPRSTTRRATDDGDRPRPPNGSSACRAATAAGAAFDADNTHYYLNHIPFADHGALLDPPTADVSARCVGLLAQLGDRGRSPGAGARRSTICGASRRPTAAGSAAGAPTTSTAPGRCCARSTPPGSSRQRPRSARAVDWLLSRQHADGGWGEGGESYWPDEPARRGAVQHGVADRLGAARR